MMSKLKKLNLIFVIAVLVLRVRGVGFANAVQGDKRLIPDKINAMTNILGSLSLT